MSISFIFSFNHKSHLLLIFETFIIKINKFHVHNNLLLEMLVNYITYLQEKKFLVFFFYQFKFLNLHVKKTYIFIYQEVF